VFNENAFIAYARLNSYMQDRIYSLFDYIECEIMEKKKDWRELVRGYLANLFINIGRYVDSAIKNVSFASFKEWNTVSAVINIIKEEYGNSGITLDALSGRLYVSKPQLSKLFKKVTGINFSDYLRSVRIKQVCVMLESGNAHVEDIARICGFHNMASFYKTFGELKNMTPNEYRSSKIHVSDEADEYENEYKKLLKGEKIMSILNEISENLQRGKAKIVKELVQQALDEGVKPADILDQGLLAGMNIVGEKFKNNEVYVPEVLVAARAMNMGSQILKPHLAEAGVQATGKVCIGTVQGDLHDIGKNLVKMMMEGKGLEVVDLGTDVSPETFVQTAIEQNCQVICCSALLTTTMGVMAEVVKAAEAAGIRDKVKIMIGGAPISQEYCDMIGADCYTVDAASAADAAVAFCK
jgi:corrinoid protein of di/trimethylamine methyltransferase